MKPIYFDISSVLTEKELESLNVLKDSPEIAGALVKVLKHKQSLFLNLAGINSVDTEAGYAKLFGVCAGLRESATVITAISEGKTEI